jgi:hypothetical protein
MVYNIMDRQVAIIEFEFMRRGAMTARELAASLNASQPTVSRILTRFKGGRIHRLGSGRSTRYALSRNIPALGSGWPLYEIDPMGQANPAGNLYCLEARQWYLEQENPWETLRWNEFTNGLYPDLPWFLDDLRPQGFLGRAFARKYGKLMGLTEDPRLWHADDIITSLLRYGRDLQGAFILGQDMLASVQEKMLADLDSLPATSRSKVFPSMADSAIAGEWPGSSAAGEQPKFTACINDGGSVRHVIVKFNGRSGRPEDERWADLLVAEHLAASILSEAGISSAKTQLLEAGGRHFLESCRFDRIGAHGRRCLVSLAALDAAFFGKADTPWTSAADRLRDTGWISAKDAENLSLRWWFGTLIGNTDMHYGNVSLYLGRNRPIELAPSYDMLPMLYRPDIEGRLPMQALSPRPPPPESISLWSRANDLATNFWSGLSKSSSVTMTFRKIARENLSIISRHHKKWAG